MDDAFKPTQLRALYDALDALKEQEQTALAELHAEDPERLLDRLRKDAETVAKYDPLDERFYDPKTRKDLPDPPTPFAELKKTEHFASHLADGNRREVAGAAELSFRYVDREIFPLRQTAPGGPRPARRSLDLLLASDDDLPIAGELKLRTDTPTYPAFIQALMYAIELNSENQRARLDEHHPGTFKWPVDGPVIDVYLIAFEPPKGGRFRPRSYEATKTISQKLVEDKRCSSVIRRIAYLEAGAEGDRLAFSTRFAFGPGTQTPRAAHTSAG
jgi:hypothetical protein